MQWPTFWDFIDKRLLNYIPLGRYQNLLSAIMEDFLGYILEPSSSEYHLVLVDVCKVSYK